MTEPQSISDLRRAKKVAEVQVSAADVHRDISQQWFDTLENSSTQDNKRYFKLGIDIGGTGISWALYPIDENGNPLDTDEKVEGKMNTRPGINALTQDYSTIISQAIAATKVRDGLLVGVGVATPGRFISEEVYRDRYGRSPVVIEDEKFGGIAGKGNIANPDALYVAPGSAEQLGETTDEFDGIDLRTLLEAFTPRMASLSVGNDADVQMVGALNNLDPALYAQHVKGKTTIFLAPGTGLGCGVHEPDGNIQGTDAHFSTMRLSPTLSADLLERFTSSDAKNEAYAILQGSEYGKADSNGIYVMADHMVTGAGMSVIARHHLAELTQDTPEVTDDMIAQFTAKHIDILRDILADDPDLGRADTVSLRLADQTEISLQPSTIKALVQRCEKTYAGVGEWMADLVEMIHKGEVNNRRSAEEQWPQAHADAVAGFSTLVFGGGVANGTLFKDIIKPAAEQALQQRGLSDITLITAQEDAKQTAQFSAAQTVGNASSNGLNLMVAGNFEALQTEAHQRLVG